MLRQFTGLIFMVLLTTGAWAAEQNGNVIQEDADTVVLESPTEGNGLVYVVRPIGDQPQIQFYVYLEETNKESLIGYTLGGKHIYFQVTPGEHIIYSSGSNIKSIKINIKAGETLFIKQRVALDPIGGSNQDNLEMVPVDAGKMLVKQTVKGFLYEHENVDEDVK